MLVRFFIDKKDKELQGLFLSLAGEKDPQRLRKTKLTKGRLKAFLANKYDGFITEKILRVLRPAFSINKDNALSFDEYC